MEEYFDVLNEKGEYTGKIESREKCHRKGLWHKKSPVVIAGILCAVLGVGALLPGKLAHTHADEGTVHYDLSKEALSGDESELLLANPDRGLRMEAYLNVGTGMSESAGGAVRLRQSTACAGLFLFDRI